MVSIKAFLFFTPQTNKPILGDTFEKFPTNHHLPPRRSLSRRNTLFRRRIRGRTQENSLLCTHLAQKTIILDRTCQVDLPLNQIAPQFPQICAIISIVFTSSNRDGSPPRYFPVAKDTPIARCLSFSHPPLTSEHKK